MDTNRATPVTLRDVARAAGVSIASASRALGREGKVSADLRRRILNAAARLGYTPNLAARSLAGRRSGLVGVLVGNLADPVIAVALTALERRLGVAGYGVMIAAPQGSEQRLEALGGLLGHGAEAVVLAETIHGPELDDAIRARGLLCVSMGVGAQPAVAAGRRRGATLAARYLLDLGHRRIGVLAPTGDGIAAGVTDALAGSDARVQLDGLNPPANDLDAVPPALSHLLDSDDAPTALVCGSDLFALAATRECLGRGIAVPRGLSIVGFGDAEFARRASPALTTVRIGAADMGLRLAEGLLSSLEHGGGLAPAFEMPVKLVVRESTGRAPR